MMSFFEQHAIYVVLVIALVIWLGLALYVNKLDGSVKELEQQIKK
jgi:CcmD family protein